MGPPIGVNYVGFTYFNNSTSCLCVYVAMLIRVVVEKNSAVKRTSVFIAAQ